MGHNKLWAKVHGKALWKHAHDLLESVVDKLVLVVPAGEEDRFAEHTSATIVAGGASRMESFKAGLAAVDIESLDIVLDHNAGSPFVTEAEISAVIAAATESGAAALFHPVVDTVLDANNAPLNRDELKLMQTPQAIRGDVLAEISLSDATDLSSALAGKTEIHFIRANPLNRKITFPEELQALQKHFTIGEDSHQFSDAGTLTLAGLKVEGCPAMEANSDGDVILHAIGRALAQAQGRSFSEHADSLCAQGQTQSHAYLAELMEGLNIHNVALSIEGARPRIDELPVQDSLAKILKIQTSQIQVSAHTGEALSAFGRGEGLRCICILQSS